MTLGGTTTHSVPRAQLRGLRAPRESGWPAPARATTCLCASAALLVLSQPPFAIAVLAPLALAPLVLWLERCRPRSAFAAGWLLTTGSGLALAYWLPDGLARAIGGEAWRAWLVVIAMISLCGVLSACAAAFYAWLRPALAAAASPIVFAALWVGSEWLRAEVLGLPWVLSSHAVARVPAAIQLAAWGGSFAVGFALVLVGSSLAVAAARRDPRALLPAAAALLLLFVPLWLSEGPGRDGAPRETLFRVGVVHRDTAAPQGASLARSLQETAAYMKQSRRLEESQDLDLVAWPESAIDVDLGAEPQVQRAVGAFARELAVPILSGAPERLGGEAAAQTFNVALLFDPENGEVSGRYAKQWLVPIAESRSESPSTALAARLLGAAPGRVTPGARPTVFDQLAVPFATPICLEIASSRIVRTLRGAGAHFFVNPTNDAWVAPSARLAQAEMQLVHAIYRAVENRAAVLRVASGGISAFIDPWGHVRREIRAPDDVAGAARGLGRHFVAEIEAPAGPGPAPLEPTIYSQRGDLPLLLLWGSVAGGALVLRLRHKRMGDS